MYNSRKTFFKCSYVKISDCILIILNLYFNFFTVIHKLSCVNAALECLNLHTLPVVFSQKNGGKCSNQHRENPDIGSSWRWNLGAGQWWRVTWNQRAAPGRVGGNKGAGGRRVGESRPPSRSPPDPRGWGWGEGWTHPRPVPGGRGSHHAATGILKVLANVVLHWGIEYCWFTKEKWYMHWLSKRRHFSVDSLRKNDICIDLVKVGNFHVDSVRRNDTSIELVKAGMSKNCPCWLRKEKWCIVTALTRFRSSQTNMLSQSANALIYTESARKSFPLRLSQRGNYFWNTVRVIVNTHCNSFRLN